MGKSGEHGASRSDILFGDAMRSCQRGFTVIELMMALAISALILTVVYSSFNSAEQVRSRIEVGNASHHISRVISSRLGRELLSLQFRKEEADSRFHSTVQSGDRLLEFVAARAHRWHPNRVCRRRLSIACVRRETMNRGRWFLNGANSRP